MILLEGVDDPTPWRMVFSTAPTDRLTLAPDLAAVGRARRFVQGCCERVSLERDTTDVAVLLTSEAVTNAFLHGRSDARLSVTVDRLALGVFVEVGDDNSRHPHRVELDDDALDGRGLTIMANLAAHWGVRNETVGKTVWFHVVTDRA